MHNHTVELAVGSAVLPLGIWLLLRSPRIRAPLASYVARLPIIAPILTLHRTAVFCRNLGILLSSGVTLTATLRILVDVMGGDKASVWTATADRVRHGGKLSEALVAGAVLPPMALRMLRLGEETGQLAMARRPCRGFLRSQVAAQPRTSRGRGWAARHHIDQRRRRRLDCFGHDSAVVGQSGRRMNCKTIRGIK